MARRKTQLKVYEHHIACPYCGTAIDFLSLAETIDLAHKTCPKCSKEFVIENGEPQHLQLKKPPQKTKAALAKRKASR